MAVGRRSRRARRLARSGRQLRGVGRTTACAWPPGATVVLALIGSSWSCWPPARRAGAASGRRPRPGTGRAPAVAAMSWLRTVRVSADAAGPARGRDGRRGLAGVVGVHVVLRRLPFFTMAMTHATFPGVVLAALAGVSLFIGAAAFGLVVVVLSSPCSGAPTGSTRRPRPASCWPAASPSACCSSRPSPASPGPHRVPRRLDAHRPAADLLDHRAVGRGSCWPCSPRLHKELVLGAFDPGGPPPSATRCWLLDVAAARRHRAHRRDRHPGRRHHPGRGPDRAPAADRPPLDRPARRHRWRWPPASAPQRRRSAWPSPAVATSPPAPTIVLVAAALFAVSLGSSPPPRAARPPAGLKNCSPRLWTLSQVVAPAPNRHRFGAERSGDEAIAPTACDRLQSADRRPRTRNATPRLAPALAVRRPSGQP